MKYGDQKIYRTFEEFEREELRRADGFSNVMDDMLNEMFSGESDRIFKSMQGDPNEDEE
jgi:hypothetical protein